MEMESTQLKAQGALPLDPGFGESGQVRPNLQSGSVRAMQLSADESVYFTAWQNENALYRTTPDGGVDPSFGNGTGHVKWRFVSGEESRPSCVLVQADHKILVIGDTRRDGTGRVALTRFHSSGSPDLVFGTVLIPVLDEEYVLLELVSGCLQSDGKILVTFSYRTAEGRLSLLIRLTAATGSLDMSFGNGGVAEVKHADYPIELRSVLVRDDGKIIVGGTADDQLVIACVTPNGEVDTTFADKGFGFYRSPGTPLRMRQMVAQADGKLVCAGAASIGNSRTMGMVMRFNADASPDSSFNGASPVLTDAERNTFWNALAIQSDGKIVMTGNNANLQILVIAARLLPDGRPDTSFGGNGWGSLGVGGLSWGVSVQSNRIIVAGENLNDAGARTPTVYGVQL